MRAFKIHLLLIGHIRKNMPTMFGARPRPLARLPARLPACPPSPAAPACTADAACLSPRRRAGKEKAQRKMLEELGEIFRQVGRRCGGRRPPAAGPPGRRGLRPCAPARAPGPPPQSSAAPGHLAPAPAAPRPPQVQRENHLPPGDFPDINRFRDILSAFDFTGFPKLTKQMVQQVDSVLSVDIPNLVKQFDNPYQ